MVNTSNTVVAEYSFDAWGRRRNPNDWSYNLTGQPELFADRGFTGHEYLKWFNLYNMNGRLYDPSVGRFLSADPYIQDAGHTQSYNRYSYCLNNPLKYTDPSGYLRRKNEADAFAETMNHRNDDFMLNHGGGSGGNIGRPGFGLNGTGLNGYYYDWYSATHRSTASGNPEVSWNEVYINVASYGDSYSVLDKGMHDQEYTNAYRPNPKGKFHLYVAYPDMIKTGKSINKTKGVIDATIELIGGVSEMAVGGALTYFSAGTSTAFSAPLMLDGGVRTIASVQRLWMYSNGNASLANAFPTSLGTLTGKGIDMAFGTSAYDVGFGQWILGWGNDLTSFVVMGGNGPALQRLQELPSLGNALNYSFSVISYPYSMFNNTPSR